MLLEKEKLLSLQAISPFCTVFKRLELHTCKKHRFVWERVNPLPHNKILDQSKLKAFANDKLKVSNWHNFSCIR